MVNDLKMEAKLHIETPSRILTIKTSKNVYT